MSIKKKNRRRVFEDRDLEAIRRMIKRSREKRMNERMMRLRKKIRGIRSVEYKGDIRDRGRSVMSFLCGMMMRSGNRRQMECKINRVVKSVRERFGCNVDRLLSEVRDKLILRVGLFKRRVSGTNRSIPMMLPEYKSVRGSWKRLVRGIRGRSERGIESKMKGEIFDIVSGYGNSYKVRKEDSVKIRKGKVWLKYLRK